MQFLRPHDPSLSYSTANCFTGLAKDLLATLSNNDNADGLDALLEDSTAALSANLLEDSTAALSANL